MQGIQARGLVKCFGRVRALEGVTVGVGTGEVVALLGPNGAGKSSLLRILGTTLLPDSGAASIDGIDVVAEPAEARRRTGLMLADDRSFYLRLSGRRNLEFWAALHGLGRAEAAERGAELLERFGLTEAADRSIGGYSAGMKARLGLARALVGDPRALLLDEPTRSLDPLAAIALRELVAERARSQTAVLLATHDLHEAAAIADRVLVLHGGALVAERSGDHDAADLERVLVGIS